MVHFSYGPHCAIKSHYSTAPPSSWALGFKDCHSKFLLVVPLTTKRGICKTAKTKCPPRPPLDRVLEDHSPGIPCLHHLNTASKAASVSPIGLSCQGLAIHKHLHSQPANAKLLTVYQGNHTRLPSCLRWTRFTGKEKGQGGIGRL